MPRIIALVCAAGLMSGCASLTQGTEQDISIVTEPSGASCAAWRDGTLLGVVEPTPGQLTVTRSKHDILVTCELDGYAREDGALESDFAGMTAGNILIGGVIGVGIDAATGAMNEYDPTLLIELDAVETELPGVDAAAGGQELPAPAPAAPGA